MNEEQAEEAIELLRLIERHLSTLVTFVNRLNLPTWLVKRG